VNAIRNHLEYSHPVFFRLLISVLLKSITKVSVILSYSSLNSAEQNVEGFGKLGTMSMVLGALYAAVCGIEVRETYSFTV